MKNRHPLLSYLIFVLFWGGVSFAFMLIAYGAVTGRW